MNLRDLQRQVAQVLSGAGGALPAVSRETHGALILARELLVAKRAEPRPA